MKKLLLITSLFFSLTFSSCTDEHPLFDGGNSIGGIGINNTTQMLLNITGNDSSNQEEGVIDLRIDINDLEGNTLNGTTIQITKTISGELYEGNSNEEGSCKMSVNSAGIYSLSVLVKDTPLPITDLQNKENNLTVKVAY